MGINDVIVVQFAIEHAQEIKSLLFKYGSIVYATNHPVRKGNYVQKKIWLDRPDSLDEGETGRYENQARELIYKLNQIGEVVSSQIAEFQAPSQEVHL